MFRILLLVIFSFTAFAGGLQKTAKVEELPRTVDELFAQKDTKKQKERFRTVEGKKIRGYFVRFDGDTLVLHDRPTGWSNPVTKLVSLRMIKTLQVDRRRTNKLAIPLAVSGGIAIVGLIAGSGAIFVPAVGAYVISTIAVAVAKGWPSCHTTTVQ